MHFIAMLIIGLIAGTLAKLLMPGKHSHSILTTMSLGVVGAVVAGFIGKAVGWYQTPADGPGIIASTVGGSLYWQFTIWSFETDPQRLLRPGSNPNV